MDREDGNRSAAAGRRMLLRAMGGAALALPALAGAAQAAAANAGARTAAPAAASGAPDLADPAANVRLLVKLEGSLDGAPGIVWTSGELLRTVPGELAETLLAYDRCQIRVFRPLGDGGYECRKHNWMLTRDPASGEYVTEYADPATGERRRAPRFLVRNTRMRYEPRGLSWVDIRTEPAVVMSPFRLGFAAVRDTAWVTATHTLRTAKQDGTMGVETARTTYRASRAALLDPSAPAVPCELDDLLQVEAPPRRAGEAAGLLVYTGRGARLASVDELPEAFRRASERAFPGVLSDRPG